MSAVGRSTIRLIGSLLICLVAAPSAFAWGREGHQIVAAIAKQRLSETARAAIADLLGDLDSMANESVPAWADEIRRERQVTAPWHYVNVPVGVASVVGYDGARDGKGGDTIVGAISRFEAVLKDKSAPRQDRIEALKFLIHFVGDIHQPLHCAARNNDRGGNSVLAYMPGATGQASNLHRIWDGELLRVYLAGKTSLEYAKTLTDQLDGTSAAAWSASPTPEAWATDGWQVAEAHVYPAVPHGQVTQLTAGYVAAVRPVVDTQLQKGGVRLAIVLNRALADR